MSKKSSLCRLLVIVFALSFISCGKSEKEIHNEIILATVRDRTISLNEFLSRAEYTARPPYCAGNGNLDKKIVLNSLIAEKLLAIEAADSSELVKNKRFQNYIIGRQEQDMREILFHNEGTQKVQLDENEIRKVFDVSGRTYKVQYYQITDDSLAGIAKQELSDNKSIFEHIYKKYTGSDEIAEREVSWEETENPVLQKALFSQRLNKDQIIGPLKIEDNYYIMMKIKGWINRPAVSEKAKQIRWNDIEEVLTQRKAAELFEAFTVNIMHGKKLEFDRKTFFQMLNIIQPIYQLKPQLTGELFFSRTSEVPFAKELNVKFDKIREHVFLRINGEKWTVQDFYEELQKHPLVFRKTYNENNFANQFKMAVVDLVKDKYLTQEAYKRGYHNLDIIQRNTQMWRDALIAEYKVYQALHALIPNYADTSITIKTVEDYLNPYINELQAKYENQIKINVQKFNEIKLTRINMFAVKRNVPFTVLVPSFPVLTTDHKLDYGKRMYN